MSLYNPDVWVIVKISSKLQTYYRVLAGWYGGYSGSDGWKFSSGITKIIDHKTYHEIHNVSGSIYHCMKDTEKLSSMTESVFNQYIKQVSEYPEPISFSKVNLNDIDTTLFIEE